MESPITAAKAAFKPANLIRMALGVVAVLLVMDAFGITDYFLYPYSTINGKFAGGKLPGGSMRGAQ